MKKILALALLFALIVLSCSKSGKQDKPLSTQQTIALMKADPDISKAFTAMTRSGSISEMQGAANELSRVIKVKYPLINARGQGGAIVAAVASQFKKNVPQEVVATTSPTPVPTGPTPTLVGPNPCVGRFQSDMHECDVDMGITLVTGLSSFSGGILSGFIGSAIGTATAIYNHRRCTSRADEAFRRCLQEWRDGPNGGRVVTLPDGRTVLVDELIRATFELVYIEIP